MTGQFIYYAISIIFGLGYLALIELGFENISALILLGGVILLLVVIAYINWIKNSEKKLKIDSKNKKLSKREILKNKLEKKPQNGI